MKEDLRVVKTKENIKNGFIHLLSKNTFKDITIQMLVHECKINKSTFYRHYEDKYDLVEQISSELLSSYKQASCLFQTDMTSITIENMISFFENNKETLLILESKQLPIQMFLDMHEILTQDIYQYFDKVNLHNDIIYLYSGLIANNILLTIKYCHQGMYKLSKEELVKIILQTIEQGLEETALNISSTNINK